MGLLGITGNNICTTFIVAISLVAMLTINAMVIYQNPAVNSEKKLNQISKNYEILPRTINNEENNFPLILLYEAKYPNSNTRWDSATWAGWGYHDKVNMEGKELEQTLIWAAEGAKLKKTCDVPCYVTKDQSLLSQADAVVMELVGHQRVFNEKRPPIPWPDRYTDQLWTLFYYEPQSWYAPIVEDELILNRFDIVMSPKQTSTLPITLICEWGKSRDDYLSPPPPKINTPNFVCDFSSTFDPNFKRDLKDFRRVVGVDTFAGEYKNMNGGNFETLPERMKLVGQYKFVLITEGAFEKDWVSPEWSQAFLAGTVPVYLGTSNIDDFAPGPHSYINFEKYGNAEALADYLIHLNQNDEEYMEYFAWKQNGLSESFKRHLDNCAHLGECRLCKEVIARRNEREGKNE